MKPPASAEGLPSVAVVVAFHKPSLPLARRQIASLLGQTGVNLTCVAVLDGAETAEDAELLALLQQADFALVINTDPLGIRKAFAEGLREALTISHDRAVNSLFAYCDQDDVWHPQKLSRSMGVAQATGAALVYCDARVVDHRGTVIASSLHRYETRREARDLLGMLLLNSVTGMTAVFTRDTAKLAVELIDSYDGNLLHDHITAVAAASLGRIVLLDEALMDYVQHANNQIGARMHYPWRSRAFGAGHLAAYRRTSKFMFQERRTLAAALEARKLLPPAIAAMFLTGAGPSLLRLFVSFEVAIWRLFAQGQPRRAMLAIRMMDVAFTKRLRGD